MSFSLLRLSCSWSIEEGKKTRCFFFRTERTLFMRGGEEGTRFQGERFTEEGPVRDDGFFLFFFFSFLLEKRTTKNKKSRSGKEREFPLFFSVLAHAFCDLNIHPFLYVAPSTLGSLLFASWFACVIWGRRVRRKKGRKKQKHVFGLQSPSRFKVSLLFSSLFPPSPLKASPGP